MTQEWDSLTRQMDEWARAMDRFMDRMQQVACAQQPTPSLALECWRPAINVYETPENVVVLVELAGIKPEDVTILLESNRLIIEGQRPNMMPNSVQTLYQIEIWSGSFAFQVPLPTQIDPAQSEATYQAGLLELKMAKRPVNLPANHEENSQKSVSVHIHMQGEMLL